LGVGGRGVGGRGWGGGAGGRSDGRAYAWGYRMEAACGEQRWETSRGRGGDPRGRFVTQPEPGCSRRHAGRLFTSRHVMEVVRHLSTRKSAAFQTQPHFPSDRERHALRCTSHSSPPPVCLEVRRRWIMVLSQAHGPGQQTTAIWARARAGLRGMHGSWRWSRDTCSTAEHLVQIRSPACTLPHSSPARTAAGGRLRPCTQDCPPPRHATQTCLHHNRLLPVRTGASEHAQHHEHAATTSAAGDNVRPWATTSALFITRCRGTQRRR
jgi:hypothetical protein